MGQLGVRQVVNLPPSFEAGAVCTKVCPYGSVRGVLGNQHPYRDFEQGCFRQLKGTTDFRRRSFSGVAYRGHWGDAVNEAYERLVRADVKYPFSIDMASLKAE